MADRLRRIVGILLLLTVAVLAFSREVDRSVESLVARWAPPPSDFVDLGGQMVHLRDVGPIGDPTPIVLVHGTSSSLHTWEPWVKELQKTRRVITFDLPGFGLTGPRDDARYTAEDDARFTIALLDRLKVQRFTIGGNSLGGMVAWQVATLVPDRVDRVVLVDAAGIPDSLRSVPVGWRIARLPFIGALAEWTLPRPLVTEGLVTVYGDPEKITGEVVDRHFELTLRQGNRAALRQRLQQFNPDGDARRIAQVRQPTLILWGGRDRVFPVAAAREFQRLIPGSELVVFDTLGHVPHEEGPVATLAPVLSFLARP